MLSYGAGKTETIKITGAASGGVKNQQKSVEQLQELLERLRVEGYHVINVTDMSLPNERTTTYVFYKD